ncbi:hypothetical protein [Nonomuraea africana]|uniref:Uncharacterized protein n=1 Tax=Nonomuraea africana TaxID=46171 RepID=A0ABR9KPV3_9ACTN|nr:hypothetical protein [Nonomuraea africana]MBE1563790.1 hypothetical protein [Nonomuraea africana]
MTMIWPPAEPPVAERWRMWPAAEVFPARLPGTTPSGARTTYVLVGIAPESPCAAAFQDGVRLPGCRTALRATYTESTQTFVATAGIAVLTGPPPAERNRDPRPVTVRPYPVQGGPAELFGQRQYIAGARESARERYVVLTAAGYTDGRPYTEGQAAPPRLRGMAEQLARALHGRLTG